MTFNNNNVLRYFLRAEIIQQILSKYLTVVDISQLDIDLCTSIKRPFYLEHIGSENCVWKGDYRGKVDPQQISGMSAWNIRVRALICASLNRTIAIQIRGIGHCIEMLDLSNCGNIGDDCVTGIVDGCTQIRRLSLAQCMEITDISLIRIAKKCKK